MAWGTASDCAMEDPLGCIEVCWAGDGTKLRATNMKHEPKPIPIRRNVAEAVLSAILRRDVNFVIATRRI